MKNSIDWSRLLNKLYKLESKLLQKVENRIEEVVITVFEKKRLNPKLKPFRKKIDSKEISEKHHNISSSFRVRGLLEDLTKSKEEKAILANEKMKDVMNGIGVEVKTDKLRRPGNVDRERSTARNLIITLNWDV